MSFSPEQLVEANFGWIGSGIVAVIVLLTWAPVEEYLKKHGYIAPTSEPEKPKKKRRRKKKK